MVAIRDFNNMRNADIEIAEIQEFRDSGIEELNRKKLPKYGKIPQFPNSSIPQFLCFVLRVSHFEFEFSVCLHQCLILTY